MAIYRHIYIEFWDDTDMIELNPEVKYFYLFLMTNPKTTQCGIYQISKMQMVYYTGFDIDKVSKNLQILMDIDKIMYNSDTKEVAVKNWAKYNFSKSPSVITCINKEFISVKDKSLIEYVYCVDTLLILQGEKEKEKEDKKKNKKKSKAIANIFESIYINYPRKLGKVDALRHFSRQYDESDNTEKLIIDMNLAISNYIKVCLKDQTESQYILHASTFFNTRWVDFADYKDVKFKKPEQNPTKTFKDDKEKMAAHKKATSPNLSKQINELVNKKKVDV